jgi:hypothetical protein
MWKPDQAQIVYPTTGFNEYNLTKTIESSVIDDDVDQGQKTYLSVVVLPINPSTPFTGAHFAIFQEGQNEALQLEYLRCWKLRRLIEDRRMPKRTAIGTNCRILNGVAVLPADR